MGSQKRIKDEWIKLEETKSGEVLITAEFKEQLQSSDITPVSKLSEIEKGTGQVLHEYVKNQSKPKEALNAAKLMIQVHRAKKLEKRGFFGKADPYAQFKCGDTIIRSKAIKNTVNPEWNFSTEINLKEENLKDLVSIEIYDEDIGKDDPMGVTYINLNTLKNQPINNQWIKLDKCKSGQVLITASDKHDCTFDYKELGAEEIRKSNPVV